MTGREQSSAAESRSEDRERFWREFCEAYARLAADEDAWAEIRAERVTEESSLRDGLG
jgi:hypothetical protein